MSASAFWILWILLAIVAAIGEVMGTGLFLASIAVAALATALVAVLGISVVFQVLAFVGFSLVGIAIFRPIVVHALGINVADQLTGTVSHPHLAGKHAVVTQTVDANGGQIRIGEGEFWSARPYDANLQFPPGTHVDIVLVDGVTALVEQSQQQPKLEEPAGAKPAER
jgi:membrane protein implicated in regulation of membrane protease activity